MSIYNLVKHRSYLSILWFIRKLGTSIEFLIKSVIESPMDRDVSVDKSIDIAHSHLDNDKAVIHTLHSYTDNTNSIFFFVNN